MKPKVFLYLQNAQESTFHSENTLMDLDENAPWKFWALLVELNKTCQLKVLALNKYELWRSPQRYMRI